MNHKVSVVKIKDNIHKGIIESLDLIDFKLDKSYDNILIKPNLSYYWKASTGATTDPVFVSNIIKILSENYGFEKDIKIIESDASAMRIKHAYTILDYDDLGSQSGVELVNLSQLEKVKKTLNINGEEITISLPNILFENNYLINVPKFKIIGITKITCATKNLFGCLTTKRKYRYHDFISKFIVELSQLIKPNLNIVDGIISLGTKPVKLDMILSGYDPLEVDYVAANIFGYGPNSIDFLKYGKKYYDPRKIIQVGEDVSQFKKKINVPNAFISKYSNQLQLKLLYLYAFIVGDIIPPFLESDQ